MIRKASAIWNGTGKEGKGSLSSTSGVLNDTPYSFTTRFVNDDGKLGTNPEELIAAAHAGCFTMALSFQLNKAGFTATELRTQANLHMAKVEAGFQIKSIHLKLEGVVKDITEDDFINLALEAKKGCPVSQALSAIDISLESHLVKA